jgi:hypothetical protein
MFPITGGKMKIIFEFDVHHEFEDMAEVIAEAIDYNIDEIMCGDGQVQDSNHGTQMIGDVIVSWKYEVES